MEFSHRSIEKKWQEFWEANDSFRTTDKSEHKAYILDMFPYPSGAGLHVGHPKGYTATDVIARKRRLEGYDVLHPIGWDAFGLPAEQYAIQTGNDPAEFTERNINNFRTQLKALAFSFDYKKEVNTSTPGYYKTTQWIFEQLFKHGLAELKEVDVNWCAELGTVLANEEVLIENGKMVSERGSFPVVKKPMRQWVLKITKYAEKLLAGLDSLDWPDSVKELQRNWIGKSIGAQISFKVANSDAQIDVFTTRADTIFGVEYLVLAPEHPLVAQLTTSAQQAAVTTFIDYVKTQTDLDRQDGSKSKQGVFLGHFAINPANGKQIPIWIADYVLPSYGTGAVMAVPAHDERDFAFAQKYDLPITYVLACKDHSRVFTKDAEHINSEYLNGLNIDQAIKKAIATLQAQGVAKESINYKLRDWLFSRQRYWGEPFPIIHWEDGSISLVDEADLPLTLPKTNNIKPSATGESPLANITDWVNVVAANGMKGRRETNTMPQWAGSCWYYIGYLLKNDDGTMLELTSPEAQARLKKWLPVDLYIGGQEHAVLHLLYARFWHQFLYDLNVVPTPEPFMKLINQGMILGPDGQKMSKSKGNVINPDDVIRSHGADTLRLYEMFMGPLEASLPWSPTGLDGARKWIDRVYRLVKADNFTDVNNHNLDFAFHNCVKKVTEMLNNYSFNTAISQLMVFINACYKEEQPIYRPYFKQFLTMMSVFTPHIAQEMWSMLGDASDITWSQWPVYEAQYLESDTVTVAVQIMGKLKGTIEVTKGTDQATLIAQAQALPVVAQALTGKTIVKTVAVVDRIVNFVVK